MLTKLLDWVASRFPLNIKYNAACHSDHYHPLDPPLEVAEPQASLWD